MTGRTISTVDLDALLTGPFTRSQAARAGVGRRALARLIAAGHVVSVTRNVCLARWLLDDPRARAAALGLALPTGAAVCRDTAAWMHGVDVRPPGSHQELVGLQVLVPLATTPPRLPGVQAFQSDLPADDTCEVGGVRATSVVRTAVDLLRYAPPFLGLAALDEWAHRGTVDLVEIEGRVEQLRGRRFAAKARRLASLCEPATESHGESWMRLRVVDAGLPRPRVQIPIELGGRTIYRLDAGYDELKVGFEYDGEAFHTGAEIEAADAARRDDLLRRFGWTVVGVRREHVLAAHPPVEAIVAELIGWARPLVRRVW